MMFWHLSISDTYPMEIRDLRALLAVVRCGSFTAAAKELGYTQSAISQQVAALELELGHQLVQRRPVRPTTAGQRLAEHAARILLRLDVARSELSQLGHEPAEVRVAVCPLAAPQLLAAALREVRSTNPLLRVTIRSVDPRSAVAEAPLVVARPADHPLQNRERIDLDVLADAPWIVAPALAGGADERAPTGPRRGLQVVYDGKDLPTLLALIAAGLGAALLPAPSCAGVDDVTAIPLWSPRLVHRTELLALRTATPRQQLVIEVLRAKASLR